MAGPVGGCSERAPRRPPCRVPPASVPAGDPLKSAPLPQGELGAVGVRERGHVLLARFCLIRSRAGALEPGGAGTADAGPAAVMLVIGGDVADRGVQPDRVVLGADPVKLGVERGRVADLVQVWPVALQVAEERFDVRLIGGRPGPAMMLGDRHQRHELAGVDRGHLGAVV